MVNEKIKVLIFPAGSEIALEIYNSLKYNLHVELFGASGKSDHAKFIYGKGHYFEDDYYITNPHFIEDFNSLLEQLKIDVVMPTHDSIALFLAQHKTIIKAKVLTSPYQTALTAREKKLTYNLFKKFNFCPKVYDHPYNDAVFPIFLKPNIGQGAKGSCVANNKEELLLKVGENPDLIVCEYLPGEELSVDCFTNKKGELLFVGPRTRGRIEMGISFRSSSVPMTPEIQEIAEAINNGVKIRGAWFFQLKKDSKGKFKLLEFAVRQASTMGLYRQLGVNFALLSIFDSQNIDVKILKNDYFIELDRCLHNKYKISLEYSRVYIDFDDTLIVNNKVNEVALQYLYQCKYRHIKICLLTKHEFDLDESLQKYCLAKNLFDEIILIKPDEDKTKFILPEKSIFIDNYFFDREKVKRELGIPVFDVDAVESLLD
jgi:hypothetical protein